VVSLRVWFDSDSNDENGDPIYLPSRKGITISRSKLPELAAAVAALLGAQEEQQAAGADRWRSRCRPKRSRRSPSALPRSPRDDSDPPQSAGGDCFTVVKEATATRFGYFGYFSDPDGYLWKVATSADRQNMS
jgi:hypothetical protein